MLSNEALGFTDQFKSGSATCEHRPGWPGDVSGLREVMQFSTLGPLGPGVSLTVYAKYPDIAIHLKLFRRAVSTGRRIICQPFA